MSKISGLGMTTFSVDDATPTLQDLKNEVEEFDLAMPRGMQEVTGVDKSAFERIPLLADFSITMKGTFNPSATKSHAVFRTVSSSATVRTVSLAHSSQTLSVECLFTDYQLNRAKDGSLTWTVPGVLADGTVPTWGP